MKPIKACAASLLIIVAYTHAKVNLELAVMRNSMINVGKPIVLNLKEPLIEVYRDEKTYIEAELLSEKDSMPVVRFIVASKSDNGAMIVRGMPQMSTSIAKGLGMGTLQCDGPDESFTLITAVAKAD